MCIDIWRYILTVTLLALGLGTFLRWPSGSMGVARCQFIQDLNKNFNRLEMKDFY